MIEKYRVRMKIKADVNFHYCQIKFEMLCYQFQEFFHIKLGVEDHEDHTETALFKLVLHFILPVDHITRIYLQTSV